MLLVIVVISDNIQPVLLRASAVQTCSVCRVVEDSEK